MKYFCEDAPEYHIAVAGSLLGISLHKDVSYPVGKVDEINVYPLNFAEFLLAKGEIEAYKLLKNKDFSTTNLIHEKYVDLLRQYYYVGGMPEAVKVYIDTEGSLPYYFGNYFPKFVKSNFNIPCQNYNEQLK